MKSKLFLIILFLTLLFTSLNVFAQQPYVLLISFDGFRWDYSERGITPNIDKMKTEGIHAISLRPSFPSKTFPNHYAIITGMYPENNGIIANEFIDPINHKKYRLGDTNSVRESKWYLGEAFWETARRNGIISASYFWPGSEMNLEYRRPNYYEKYVHTRPYKERVDGVINWLKLPQDERPHFIMLYCHDTDTYGHKCGPNSIEINQSIQRLDSVIGYLNEKLNETSIKDSLNIILVSDHGMTEISNDKIINIDNILLGSDFTMQGNGPFSLINAINKKEDIKDIYEILKNNEYHYKVYLKKDVPDYYHYSANPFISPIVVIADLGWSIVNNNVLKRMKKSNSKGNHGYDNNQLDMHGVFIANGPAFKSHYNTGTVWNIDIYPLLCKIYNIEPRSNIDSKLERIEFILK